MNIHRGTMNICIDKIDLKFDELESALIELDKDPSVFSRIELNISEDVIINDGYTRLKRRENKSIYIYQDRFSGCKKAHIKFIKDLSEIEEFCITKPYYANFKEAYEQIKNLYNSMGEMDDKSNNTEPKDKFN